MFILHQGLIDYHSHYYGEALGWQAACRAQNITAHFYLGARTHVHMLAQFDAKPAFQYPSDTVLDPDPSCRVLSDFLTIAEHFAQDCAALEKDGTTGDDMAIITAATDRDILGAALWLEKISPASRPALIFIFHAPDFGWSVNEDRSRFEGDVSRHRYAMKRLKAVLPAEKTIVLAATPQLAGVFTQVLQHPCAAFALPTHFVDDAVLSSGAPEQQVTVRLAGEFRPEKGSDLALQVILQVAKARPGTSFAVQVSDEKTAQEVGAQLAPLADGASKCLVVFGHADHETYQRRLMQSQIVLLPYRWQRYALRGSGVFAEALGFGLVTVVPDRTWMSDMLGAGWGAGIVFREPTVEEISAAVCRAIDNYPALKEQAASRKAQWRQEHSFPALLEEILRLVPR